MGVASVLARFDELEGDLVCVLELPVRSLAEDQWNRSFET